MHEFYHALAERVSEDKRRTAHTLARNLSFLEDELSAFVRVHGRIFYITSPEQTQTYFKALAAYCDAWRFFVELLPPSVEPDDGNKPSVYDERGLLFV
jgi:hypothetical protein